MRSPKVRFNLGQIVSTPGALDAAERLGDVLLPMKLIGRHSQCDWGDICEEDVEVNEEALKHGDRLMSVYTVGTEKFWVITDRTPDDSYCVTTLLLPSEY